jgi:hypothetical protein
MAKVRIHSLFKFMSQSYCDLIFKHTDAAIYISRRLWLLEIEPRIF